MVLIYVQQLQFWNEGTVNRFFSDILLPSDIIFGQETIVLPWISFIVSEIDEAYGRGYVFFFLLDTARNIVAVQIDI